MQQHALDVFSPHEVWALAESSGTSDDYIQRIDGHRPRAIFRWAGLLYDLAAANRNDIWVVGEQDLRNRRVPLVLHWNGKRVVSQTPFPSFAGSLNAVVALSPTDVWAAGDRLIARHSC